MPIRKLLVVGVGMLALALIGALQMTGGDDTYELEFLMPSADGMYPGAAATAGGFTVGEVSAVAVQGDQARITVEIDPSNAPMHAGTLARIGWNSLIGRRQLELSPGPATNPDLPSGKLIESSVERVELDDIVATLDEPTRAKVQELVGTLEQTLEGNAVSLNQTLDSAGPFVQALGEVLRGVGQDGPAIKSLVTRLHKITSTLSDRDQELAATVENLGLLVESAAQQQTQITEALDDLPATLEAGTEFFGNVPAAVDETVPLLEDLRPATDQLPAVAAKLNPVLTDLRPTVAELRPTLAAASSLLSETPGLLDAGSATLPSLESALGSLQPAVTFLRPYTPEVIGFLTNWTSLFSAKNAAGHFGRALVPASATSFNSNPGILPPGMTQWEAPSPGQLVGQSWTDANGDAVR